MKTHYTAKKSLVAPQYIVNSGEKCEMYQKDGTEPLRNLISKLQRGIPVVKRRLIYDDSDLPMHITAKDAPQIRDLSFKLQEANSKYKDTLKSQAEERKKLLEDIEEFKKLTKNGQGKSETGT